MFPDMVKIEDLIPNTVDRGAGYTVGAINKTISGVTFSEELCGKFDGLNALFEYQAKKQPKAKHGGSSNDTGRSSFQFFKNFAEALEVYRNRPGEITELRQKDTMIDGGDSSGLELVYDVTGDMLDIGRYLTGEPEVFGSLTNGNPRNKRVNILMQLSWWAGVDKEVINERSAQIVRLVDWLESQNIRTQVIGMTTNTCIHMEIVVKRFDEPLSLADIAVVGHSDFLRRILFRMTEYSETYDSGYGRSDTLGTYWKRNSEKFASPYNDEYTLLIDGGTQSEMRAIKRAFELVEIDLLKALSEDEVSKVFKVLL